MRIRIGRDRSTGKLLVNNGTEAIVFDDMGHLPADVSEEHCVITVSHEGELYVSVPDHHIVNVNGVQVERKELQVTDVVRLGTNGYTLPLDRVLNRVMPNVYKISHLKEVWEKYSDELEGIQKRRKRNDLNFRLPMAFSLLGIFVSRVISEDFKVLLNIVAALALCWMIWGIGCFANDTTSEDEKKLKESLQGKYVCPNPLCRSYLGERSYRHLHKCPYCKSSFKH